MTTPEVTTLVATIGPVMLVLARVSAMVLAAPIFGATAVPLRVRFLLAGCLALLVAPSALAAGAQVPAGFVPLLVALGGEVAVGLLLGVGLAIVWSGMQLAGQLIGQMSGVGLGEVFNPWLGAPSTVVSQVFYLLTVAVFLLLDGHRLAIAALLDTFRTMPPGAAAISPRAVDVLTTLLGQSFLLGIRTAAPVVAALLAAMLVLGLVGRTLPQLNILAVGLGLNALLALGALFIALGSAAWALEDQIEPTLVLLKDAVSAGGS